MGGGKGEAGVREGRRKEGEGRGQYASVGLICQYVHTYVLL